MTTENNDADQGAHTSSCLRCTYVLGELLSLSSRPSALGPRTRRFRLIQEVTAKVKAMGRLGGLDSPQVAQVLGEGRGDHAALVVALMEPGGLGRIDYYEVRVCALRCVDHRTPHNYLYYNTS